MTSKEWLEIGALAVGGIAVYMVLARGSKSEIPVQDDPQPPQDVGPEYLTWNYPRDQGANSSVQLPMVGSPTTGVDQPTCACSSGTQTLLSNNNVLSDYFQGIYKDLAKNYEDNLLSSMPSFFSGGLNNNVNVGMSISQ